MSGLGLIFAGLGGAGRGLAETGAMEEKAQMERDLKKELLDMEMEKAKAIDEYKFSKEKERLPERIRQEGLISAAKRDPMEEEVRRLKLNEMKKEAKDKEEIGRLLKTRAGIAARFTGEGRATALADVDSKLAALGHTVKGESMADVEEKTVDPNTESTKTVKYKKPLSEINQGGGNSGMREQAMDAVRRGANRDDVNKRLAAAGYQPI